MKYILCILALNAFVAIHSLAVEAKTDSTFTDPEKSFLLNLARQTVNWHLKYNTTPEPDKSLQNQSEG